MQRENQPERNHLFCPFVSDETGEETLFPQMTGKSSSIAFKRTYWKCMVVLFASFRRFDKLARCSIITNSDPLRYCDEKVIQLLADLNVNIEILASDKTHRPNVERFGNVLYLFDVLDMLNEASPFDLYLCLDPDCIFASDPAVIWRQATRQGLLYYDVGSLPDENVAELSLNWLEEFARRNKWLLRSRLTHVGGEFLAFSRTELPRLLDTVKAVRSADLERRLTVEEHVLSLVVAMRGLGGNASNTHVRRIWTGPRRRDARPEDMALPLWHLPREKQFGFSDLYSDLSSMTPTRNWANMAPDRYVDYLAERMGVPTWSKRKWAGEMPRLLPKLVSEVLTFRAR